MRRGLDDACRKRSAGALAKSHAKIEQCGFAHLFKCQPVRLFGRDMAEQAVIERGRICSQEHSSSRGCHKAVDDDRNLLHPRSEDGPCHGCNFRVPRAAARVRADPSNAAYAARQRYGWHQPCAFVGGIRASACARPIFGGAAVKTMEDRRRNGRVADAHLADAQKVGSTGNRFHAEGHGGGTGLLVKRCLLRDVTGRIIERQVKHFQAKVIGNANLVDGSATGGELATICAVTSLG